MRFYHSILSILLILLYLACHSEKAKSNLETKTLNKASSIFSITDTLSKYLNADCFLNFANRRVYAGKIENIQIGFDNINDSVTFFYQLENNQWLKVDSFRYGVQFVTSEDLNGDKFHDIIATYNFTGSGGNSENVCFLFYPDQHRFRHNRYFDLPNIHYDSNTNLIQSPWWGGAISSQTKRTYSLIDDSLKFQDEIIYNPCDAYETGIVQLEYYKYKNGKRILTKMISGQGEILYDIFTKTLWNSKDDF